MSGYKFTDQNYKSTTTLIHYSVKAAGKNANLLLNIGPQPDGELTAVAVQRLAEMGEWMKQYGETIYGTRSEMCIRDSQCPGCDAICQQCFYLIFHQ